MTSWPPCIGAPVRAGHALLPSDPIVDWRGHGDGLVANRRHAWLGIVGVADFMVLDGAEVIIQVSPGISAKELDAYLDGTVAALVLAQRGEFALHGSAVDIGGAAIALAGPRGVGKSTTALALVQRGGSLLADDVLPLTRDGDLITMHPTGRPLHISPQTAELIGYDLGEATNRRNAVGKVDLSVPASGPRQLCGLAALSLATGAPELGRRRLHGVSALEVVRHNTYRIGMLMPLYAQEILTWASDVVACVPVYEIVRPTGDWTLDAVLDEVESLGRLPR